MRNDTGLLASVECGARTRASHPSAGLGTVVYLSRAFNPAPHPTNELEAARNGNRNAKFGLAAAALSYLCKMFCPVTVMLISCIVLVHVRTCMFETLPWYFASPPMLTEWCLAYAGYSTVQGPSSPLVRPHPAVWRLIHGIIVLYLVSLIFLLFQDAHDARLLLKVEASQAVTTVQTGIHVVECIQSCSHLALALLHH